MKTKLNQMTAPLYAGIRMENGTHGDVRSWISEVYAEHGVAGVAKAISWWKMAFIGSEGVYIIVEEDVVILVAPLDLTDQELEQLGY